MTDFIKALAVYHGALDVGICELQPYHIYSHIGGAAGPTAHRLISITATPSP
jgi:hypothetical protein